MTQRYLTVNRGRDDGTSIEDHAETAGQIVPGMPWRRICCRSVLRIAVVV